MLSLPNRMLFRTPWLMPKSIDTEVSLTRDRASLLLHLKTVFAGIGVQNATVDDLRFDSLASTHEEGWDKAIAVRISGLGFIGLINAMPAHDPLRLDSDQRTP